jgi:hypothetical protein
VPDVDGCSLSQPTRLVVSDSATWVWVWRWLGCRRPVPPLIDFEREIVLIAAFGSQPTTNYSIEIDSAIVKDWRARVVTTALTACACPSGKEVTSPTDLRRAPAFPWPIEVEFEDRRDLIVDCNRGVRASSAEGRVLIRRNCPRLVEP